MINNIFARDILKEIRSLDQLYWVTFTPLNALSRKVKKIKKKNRMCTNPIVLNFWSIVGATLFLTQSLSDFYQ